MSVTTSAPNKVTSDEDGVTKAAYKVNSPARAFTRGNTSLVRALVQGVEDTKVVGMARSNTRVVSFMVIEVLSCCPVSDVTLKYDKVC